MTTIYNMGDGLPFSDSIYSSKLKADTEATMTVNVSSGIGMPLPSSIDGSTNNKFRALLCTDGAAPLFVSVNSAATVPAGDTFVSTTSELVPANRSYFKYVKNGDVLHFISPGTPSVSVSLYYVVG